ncbi:hypothetical protein BDQ17DRAFT_1418985 [Cyathus striatus]|nr:hypothetical protein BDQ17DRAFT_1418985 [Cyathus striatus]
MPIPDLDSRSSPVHTDLSTHSTSPQKRSSLSPAFLSSSIPSSSSTLPSFSTSFYRTTTCPSDCSSPLSIATAILTFSAVISAQTTRSHIQSHVCAASPFNSIPSTLPSNPNQILTTLHRLFPRLHDFLQTTLYCKRVDYNPNTNTWHIVVISFIIFSSSFSSREHARGRALGVTAHT